ncbi:hypothetical protein HDU82_006062 [Entophlyctis luteolus]|nr:hypothetical protein HDU82_006062 [Entophlyctis luteolus]
MGACGAGTQLALKFMKRKRQVPQRQLRAHSDTDIDSDFAVGIDMDVDAVSRSGSSSGSDSDTGDRLPTILLKPDHAMRPIYAARNGRIYLEAFSPVSEQAVDFLVAIAEPLSRPRLIHEYLITEYSLYAAVSVGIPPDSIIAVLEKLCKTHLPQELISFIRKHTNTYGKVKLVLKNNRLFVESAFADVLAKLLQDPIISDARVSIPGQSLSAFTTEEQIFEPVSFSNQTWKGSQRVQSNTKSKEQQQTIATEPLPPVDQPIPSAESELEDLFGESDDLSFDFYQSMDPEQVTRLNRILDGHGSAENTSDPDQFAEGGFDYSLDQASSSSATEDKFALQAVAPDTQLMDTRKHSDDDEDNDDASMALALDIATLTKSVFGSGNSDQYKSNPSADLPLVQKIIVSSFEIDIQKSDAVRKACSSAGYPILSEYDFRNSATLPTLDIALKPAAILREYQERSLNKMFGNGRARSGIIVLPCGAGKTLVGVTAACTVKKRVLVLCTSAVSVEQWAREFRTWTNVKDDEIAKFTSQHKELLPKDNGILISTYTMVTFSKKRAYDAQKMMDYIQSREWGLLLLDEVHVVPADMFRKVLTIVGAHCKLGLTATLVREDDKIGNLNYLIGPKLFEANWMDLAKKGHIANVRCAEVWCTMSKEFYKEYLGQSVRKRQLLHIMNPNKIQSCQYLIDFHEARGDKVIVFSDNVFALKHYATKLNRPYIYGGSSTADRLRTLQQFKYNPSLNTIFLSKVGDTSIDIPEASCLIQISSHYGSRRQEAQRLGRILRAKKNSSGNNGFNSFFYTLVSRDTEEVFYCAKRQQFLIDQGYSYDIITKLEGMETVAPLVYSNLKERLELLATVLVSHDMIELDVVDNDGVDEMRWDESEDDDDENDNVHDGDDKDNGKDGHRSNGRTVPRLRGVQTTTTTSLRSLSGADSMAYIEQPRGHGLRHRRFG